MPMRDIRPPAVEEWQERGRPLLKGLNRLLESVYGRDVRLSQMLRESGVDPDQIEEWQQDRIWLMEFCESTSRGLLYAFLFPGFSPTTS